MTNSGGVRRGLPIVVLLLLVAPAAMTSSPSAAKDKIKKMDLIWVHPDFDSLGLKGIALLPAASFDNQRQNELTVETIAQQQLHPTGYRWMAATLAKEMMRSALGESTFAVVRQSILKNGRVDSLAALVDSSGRLLWSASGSETGEGTYHEADSGTMGVKGSGLNTSRSRRKAALRATKRSPPACWPAG